MWTIVIKQDTQKLTFLFNELHEAQEFIAIALETTLLPAEVVIFKEGSDQ